MNRQVFGRFIAGVRPRFVERCALWSTSAGWYFYAAARPQGASSAIPPRGDGNHGFPKKLHPAGLEFQYALGLVGLFLMVILLFTGIHYGLAEPSQAAPYQ